MPTETDDLAILAERARREGGMQALRALAPDLMPGYSTVEDAVYALAREVLALRVRVAKLEATERQ